MCAYVNSNSSFTSLVLKIEGSCGGHEALQECHGVTLPYPPRTLSPKTIRSGTQASPVSRDIIPAKVITGWGEIESAYVSRFIVYLVIWTWVYRWITSQWVLLLFFFYIVTWFSHTLMCICCISGMALYRLWQKVEYHSWCYPVGPWGLFSKK